MRKNIKKGHYHLTTKQRPKQSKQEKISTVSPPKQDVCTNLGSENNQPTTKNPNKKDPDQKSIRAQTSKPKPVQFQPQHPYQAYQTKTSRSPYKIA